MILYDTIIKDLYTSVRKSSFHRYEYSEKKAWPESDDFELLLQKDMAYELGGSGREALNFTCVTDDPDLIKLFCNKAEQDQILLFGRDLSNISKATSYARITLLLIDSDEELETDSDKLFHTLQDLDLIKYNVHPKGYMVRTSGQNHREQVRIGKRELKHGMNFEAIGNTFIRKYKRDQRVRQVCLLFMTDENMPYQTLLSYAKRTADIRNSLSRIKKGLPTECSVCEIKEICNEIEGLRELHFGKKADKRAAVRI